MFPCYIYHNKLPQVEQVLCLSLYSLATLPLCLRHQALLELKSSRFGFWLKSTSHSLGSHSRELEVVYSSHTPVQHRGYCCTGRVSNCFKRIFNRDFLHLSDEIMHGLQLSCMIMIWGMGNAGGSFNFSDRWDILSY